MSKNSKSTVKSRTSISISPETLDHIRSVAHRTKTSVSACIEAALIATFAPTESDADSTADSTAD